MIQPAQLARLEKARWPGGPKICSVENLPSFETRGELKTFLTTNSPSCKVMAEFECSACGHWHAHTIAADPAGASSGQGRSSKIKTWAEFKLICRLPASLRELLALEDSKPLEKKEPTK